MTPLYAEINRWRVLPHRWGETDCLMLPADWVKRIRGVDPAEDVRLTYETGAECQRVWRFFTEPLLAVAPRMEKAGLSRTARPVPGDVGIILVQTDPGVSRPHGALFLGRNWAVKCADGSVCALAAPKIIAAWEVGYAHP